jgi:hypothetical protein
VTVTSLLSWKVLNLRLTRVETASTWLGYNGSCEGCLTDGRELRKVDIAVGVHPGGLYMGY